MPFLAIAQQRRIVFTTYPVCADIFGRKMENRIGDWKKTHGWKDL